MDHEMNGKRVHMYSNKKDIEHHTRQETQSMDEEHTCKTIPMFFFIYFMLFFIFILLLFFSFSGNRIY